MRQSNSFAVLSKNVLSKNVLSKNVLSKNVSSKNVLQQCSEQVLLYDSVFSLNLALHKDGTGWEI
jgi:hypothetical protein